MTENMQPEFRQAHLLRRLSAAQDMVYANELEAAGDTAGAESARASADLHDALADRQFEKFQQGGVVVRNTSTGSYEVHHGRPQGTYDPDRLGLGRTSSGQLDTPQTTEHQHTPVE